MKQAILDKEKNLVENLYRKDGFTVAEIAKRFNVSTDAVLFFMRKHKIKRRTNSESQRLSFEKSKPSFTKNKIDTKELEELSVIGAMLYWGEGYKGSIKKPAHTVDFANSDPNMIVLFLKFLRNIYIIDETKLRIYLYCYSDQDINELIGFWSKLTMIPRAQFTKPYVRSDFKDSSNKMKYGLIHIRYNDKKLLLDIKSMVDYYVYRHAPIV